MENEPPMDATTWALSPRTPWSKSPPSNAETRDVSRSGKQLHFLKVLCLGNRILPYLGIMLMTMTVVIHKNYFLTNLDSSAVSKAAFQNDTGKKKEKVKVRRSAEVVETSNENIKDIALKSIGTKPNKFPPLLLNVGRGTTGTHTFQKATCILGLPAVHWGRLCVSPTPGFEDVSPDVQNGIRSHFELKTAFKNAAFCLSSTTFCNMNVATWANALEVHGRGVVESGVVALHDTPYSYMVPFFTKLATQIRGAPPFLILSERDEEEWAQRRLDLHGPCLILCKDFFQEDVNGDFTLVQGRDLESFFDVLACIKRAKERRRRELQQYRDDSELLMGDVFVPARKLHGPQGYMILARAMKAYQDPMRGKSDYAFTLFGHHKTEFDVADEIQERLSALPPTMKDGFRNVTYYGSGNLLVQKFPREYFPTSRVAT